MIMACCDSPRPQEFQAQGTVRNVWCVEDICRVAFEHENGDLQELQFQEPVPLWAGLRCVIKYHHSNVDSQYDYLDNVARIN